MSKSKLTKTNSFGYTFEVETVKQDELKPGSHVEVNWTDFGYPPILYSGKYIKKLKKYHQIRIIDESWYRSTPFVRVPLDVIFKISTSKGIFSGQEISKEEYEEQQHDIQTQS